MIGVGATDDPEPTTRLLGRRLGVGVEDGLWGARTDYGDPPQSRDGSACRIAILLG